MKRAILISLLGAGVMFAGDSCSKSCGGQGPQGQQGPAGKDGRNGLNGVNGNNGKDGLPGTSGLNGRDGKDGINGLNGHDGKDGVDNYYFAYQGGFLNLHQIQREAHSADAQGVMTVTVFEGTQPVFTLTGTDANRLVAKLQALSQ